MKPETAARLMRWWTSAYTAVLPPEKRERRRAEVESDLWESLRDPRGSRQIVSRWLLGVTDDLGWSIAHMEPTSRSALGWSLGSFVVLAMAAAALVYMPDSAQMRESLWAWPAATALHIAGIVALIGLRLPVDLRSIGLPFPFASVSLPTLARRVTPWIVGAALLTFASGFALYAGDSAELASHPIFQIKIAALALALVNAWYGHAFGLARSDSSRTSITLEVRVSGYLSLALWTVLIGSSLLVPYTS